MTKWIIHNGDKYYPGCEIFDTYTEAKEAWENLKRLREGEEDEDREGPDYWSGDYLAQIIDENIPEKKED
jgi:hypothetical protein